MNIPNAPRCVQVISEKDLKKDEKIFLKLNKCEKCTLVQLSRENYVNVNYYNDYIMSRTCSAYSRKYQRNLAKDFISKFDLKNKLIIDIGCGDGYFALSLKNQGARVIGIEPSSVAYNLAIKKGIKTIKAYVDDDFNFNKKVDAFVACQVFEHVSYPGKLLKNIKKFLQPGGYGLIEVPSLIKSIHDSRFYDFFPDHVAYYSPTSLSYLLQLNNFDVLDVKHTANEEYITAFIRYSIHSRNDLDIQDHFFSYKKQFQTFFKKISGKKIAIWGAGAKGIASMSFSNIYENKIVFCVDSDPNKLNYYLPGSHIKIVSPDMINKERVDIVIITAMMYRDEIISTLIKKYKYNKSQIAVISPNLRFITNE
jgi:2-polyprenyl-3-methyl-5-hydroxy-6-metoxy-1,4-benzoquinol methylase